MTCPVLADLAGQFVDTALTNVLREYPFAPAHVVIGPDDNALPRAHHPAFYGAYDWHSSVHMHWLLVHLLREHADRVDRTRVREVLEEHLAPGPLRHEAAYLQADPSFERPYGWAWLMALAAECVGWRDDEGAARWGRALKPAVEVVTDHVLDWLPRAGRPVREGGPANTAFALGLLLDAARPLGRPALAEAVHAYARTWYLPDRAVPASWEPSGQDFLSPSLTEADLVRRLLPSAAYGTWLEGFLPGLAVGEPRTLLQPVPVPDRSDGRIGHLDGLNASRSAALRSVARALAVDDPRRPVLVHAADRHLDAALPALSAGEYLSSHWLATFTALALQGV